MLWTPVVPCRAFLLLGTVAPGLSAPTERVGDSEAGDGSRIRAVMRLAGGQAEVRGAGSAPRDRPLYTTMAACELYAASGLAEDLRWTETKRRKTTTKSPSGVFLPSKSGRRISAEQPD